MAIPQERERTRSSLPAQHSGSGDLSGCPLSTPVIYSMKRTLLSIAVLSPHCRERVGSIFGLDLRQGRSVSSWTAAPGPPRTSALSACPAASPQPRAWASRAPKISAAGSPANFQIEDGLLCRRSQCRGRGQLRPFATYCSGGNSFMGRQAWAGVGRTRLHQPRPEYTLGYLLLSAADPFGVGYAGTAGNLASVAGKRWNNAIIYFDADDRGLPGRRGDGARRDHRQLELGSRRSALGRLRLGTHRGPARPTPRPTPPRAPWGRRSPTSARSTTWAWPRCTRCTTTPATTSEPAHRYGRPAAGRDGPGGPRRRARQLHLP